MSVFLDVLACPVCHQADRSGHCDRCEGRFFRSLKRGTTDYAILDLTPETLENSPTTMPLRTRLFQTQAIAALYERLLPTLWKAGLRQKGIEREGDRVLAWLSDRDGIAIDLSCGTGIVTRRLLRETDYSVIALDYSDRMLAELQAHCRVEQLPADRLAIVRGDAAALPLQTASVSAIYSGAAMHCWPDAEGVMAEIFRVLAPGGKLYLTTFLKPLPSWVFRFFTPTELLQIAETAGFDRDRLHLETVGVYGILTATKSAGDR